MTFGSLGEWAQQFQLLTKMASDKNMQALLLHPKFRRLLEDSQFQEMIREKNVFKLMSHPEISELMRDPEIQELLKQIRIS